MTDKNLEVTDFKDEAELPAQRLSSDSVLYTATQDSYLSAAIKITRQDFNRVASPFDRSSITVLLLGLLLAHIIYLLVAMSHGESWTKLEVAIAFFLLTGVFASDKMSYFISKAVGKRGKTERARTWSKLNSQLTKHERSERFVETPVFATLPVDDKEEEIG